MGDTTFTIKKGTTSTTYTYKDGNIDGTCSRVPAPRFGGATELQDYPGLRFAHPGLIALTPFGSKFLNNCFSPSKWVRAISPG